MRSRGILALVVVVLVLLVGFSVTVEQPPQPQMVEWSSDWGDSTLNWSIDSTGGHWLHFGENPYTEWLIPEADRAGSANHR